MKKEKLKAKLEKIKEKGRRGREKIKKIVIKRKDDFLTALEKNWRDWLLKPLTNLFYKIGVTANQITYAGFILLAIVIWMHFQNYHIKWQLLVFVLAAITDALDGSTARNNDDITIRGSWLDHIRDFLLMAWVSYIIYLYRLLGLEVILIIWILELFVIWFKSKDFLLHYLRGLPHEQEEILISNFSLDQLQTSIIGRLQFFFWVTSYILLLAFFIVSVPILITTGQILIVLAIIFAALNILENYQKSPTTNQ